MNPFFNLGKMSYKSPQKIKGDWKTCFVATLDPQKTSRSYKNLISCLITNNTCYTILHDIFLQSSARLWEQIVKCNESVTFWIQTPTDAPDSVNKPLQFRRDSLLSTRFVEAEIECSVVVGVTFRDKFCTSMILWHLFPASLWQHRLLTFCCWKKRYTIPGLYRNYWSLPL